MFCNRPGTVTNVSIPEKTSQNKGVKKIERKKNGTIETVENFELHIHFIKSGPTRAIQASAVAGQSYCESREWGSVSLTEMGCLFLYSHT